MDDDIHKLRETKQKERNLIKTCLMCYRVMSSRTALEGHKVIHDGKNVTTIVNEDILKLYGDENENLMRVILLSRIRLC